MENIGVFTAQFSKGNNEFHKLHMFPLSLTTIVFAWYSTLLPNSIQTWVYMEKCFHDRFYWPQREATKNRFNEFKVQSGWIGWWLHL